MLQKELAEAIVCVLLESVAVLLKEKNDLTYQLPKILFFRVDNVKFFKLV